MDHFHTQLRAPVIFSAGLLGVLALVMKGNVFTSPTRADAAVAFGAIFSEEVATGGLDCTPKTGGFFKLV